MLKNFRNIGRHFSEFFRMGREVKEIRSAIQLGSRSEIGVNVSALKTTMLDIAYSKFSGHVSEKRVNFFLSQVYSQHCEDGIISEIFRRIGVGRRTFLEIGIENGTQNTTRFLLEQGWNGVWVEGNPNYAAQARKIFKKYIDNGHLKVINEVITRENVNTVLDINGIENEFDLISVDIDYNTTHVWRALNRRARVSCIEYNGSLPPSIAVEVPYNPSLYWDGTNWFGGSLKALELIGQSKGISLIGCDYIGVNAYFVTNGETSDHFCEPFTAENHYEAPKYQLTHHKGHPPSHQAREWSSVE